MQYKKDYFDLFLNYTEAGIGIDIFLHLKSLYLFHRKNNHKAKIKLKKITGYNLFKNTGADAAKSTPIY